jgi:serine/threonine-protein kinase RIM15
MDSGPSTYRRDAPSPLAFTTSPSFGSGTQDGLTFGASSASDMVSMPFVRRHVTRRLKAAKDDCNKEMQKITNSITTYFEQKLKESDYEREAEREARDRERERERAQERDWDIQRGRYRDEVSSASPDVWNDGYSFHPAELKSALQSDDGGSESGAELETERQSRHSRQRACITAKHVLKHCLAYFLFHSIQAYCIHRILESNPSSSPTRR